MLPHQVRIEYLDLKEIAPNCIYQWCVSSFGDETGGFNGDWSYSKFMKHGYYFFGFSESAFVFFKLSWADNRKIIFHDWDRVAMKMYLNRY